MPFLKDKRKLQSSSKRLENMTMKNGLRHSVFTVPGDRYIGEWKNNTKDGKGSFLTRTYRQYEGDWEKNFRHGFGVLSFRQDNKVFTLEYRGDWKKGKWSGFGARHYPDGGYYEGYFKNGKRCGPGQMWYTDGSFYDGSWFKDMRHGLGIWVRADGNRYEGAWAYDLKHGKGKFYHLDTGQMQEGVWEKDVCICSYIIDIPFRQAAVEATTHPIHHNKLTKSQEVCDVQEVKALEGLIRSCLSFSHPPEESKLENKSSDSSEDYFF